MTFLKNTIENVRELAKTLTRKEIAEKASMSMSTLNRLLQENKDIKPAAAKRGRPNKF